MKFRIFHGYSYIYTHIYIYSHWMCVCVCVCSLLCQNTLNRSKLKKKGFILAHGFRSFHPWSLESLSLGVVRQNIIAVVLTSWQPGKREKDTGRARARYSPQGQGPADLLSPARPQLLMFPRLQHMSLWEPFPIQTIIKPCIDVYVSFSWYWG
jgi:hypothetical protein